MQYFDKKHFSGLKQMHLVLYMYNIFIWWKNNLFITFYQLSAIRIFSN